MPKEIVSIIALTGYTLAWFLCFYLPVRKRNSIKLFSWIPSVLFAFGIPILVCDLNYKKDNFDDQFIIIWTLIPLLILSVILIYTKKSKC
ncbi:MAG: hypothetical protein CML13_02140 [Puniceicoccaceae bacterium]|nr:hypothetical protein [Puniceicoccaceae bacterium]|tara:strand:+ start:200 stop:469 length:270 start_codon:yes stop_codon:yes gene_type:complete